jgi:biofilm PGA synthesis N-glycosyltransferase PgaC
MAAKVRQIAVLSAAVENFAVIFQGFLLVCFLLATAVQVAVWLGLYARLARPGAPPPSRSAPSLMLSVIVCARNEAANLARYLPAVLGQRYDGFEVVVVDDASTDDTPTLLRTLAAAHPQLRAIRIDAKTHGGKKQALAAGVAAARYDHIVVTDADCEPASPYWLSHLAAAFAADPAVEIVLGVAPLCRTPGLLAGWARFETAFTAIQYAALTASGRPYMGVGRNLAWTRDVYARAGGFVRHLDRLSGDDDLLVNAAARPGRVAVCLEPAAFVYSAAPPTWPAWWRQKRRHLGAARVYRLSDRLLLGTLALSHTVHYGLAAILLLTQFGTVPVLMAYAGRLAVVWALYARILPRLGAADLALAAPFYDGLLAVWYGAFVPAGLWGRPAHQWKI